MFFLDSYANEVNGKLIIVAERNDFSSFYNATLNYISFFQKSNTVVLVEDTVKRPGEVLVYAYLKHTETSCNTHKPVIWNRFWNGSFVKGKPIFPKKFRNYHKCNFSVNANPNEPFIMLSLKGNETIMDGSDGLLLTNIAERLNFTVVIDSSQERGPKVS